MILICSRINASQYNSIFCSSKTSSMTFPFLWVLISGCFTWPAQTRTNVPSTFWQLSLFGKNGKFDRKGKDRKISWDRIFFEMKCSFKKVELMWHYYPILICELLFSIKFSTSYFDLYYRPLTFDHLKLKLKMDGIINFDLTSFEQI